MTKEQSMSERAKYHVLCPHCQKVNEDVAADRPQAPAGGVMTFKKNCIHCGGGMEVIIKLPNSLVVEAHKTEG